MAKPIEKRENTHTKKCGIGHFEQKNIPVAKWISISIKSYKATDVSWARFPRRTTRFCSSNLFFKGVLERKHLGGSIAKKFDEQQRNCLLGDRTHDTRKLYSF